MQLLIPHSAADHSRSRPGPVTDVLSPAPRDIWRGVLRDDPGATALQTPEYLDVVRVATQGEDASRFYQLADGRQLVLPLVRTRSPWGVLVEAGYPGDHGSAGMLATGGLLADDVRTVLPDLRDRPGSRWIGGAHHTRGQWAAGIGPGVTGEPRRTEVIELDRDHAGDREGFREAYYSAETRRRLRRAERHGVEVERDTTGRLVGTCHDLHRAWTERQLLRSRLPLPLARRLAVRREAHRTFAQVAALPGDRCRIFVGWHRGRPVAASIMLVHGAHAVSWRSFCIDELAGPVEAGLATLVAGIEDAVDAGCRAIDLGPSGGATGAEPGQSPLGAEPRPVVDLRIEPPGLTRLRAARHRSRGIAAWS